MPFKSEKQRRHLYANKPSMAAEFQRRENRFKAHKKEKKK